MLDWPLKTLFAAAACLAFAQPTNAAFDGAHIIQIIDPRSELPKAMISIGSEAGLSDGDTLIVERDLVDESHEEGSIVTGKLKVIQTLKDYALAMIVSEGTEASRSAFPKHPTVMAGDMVKKEDIKLANVAVVLPEVAISYDDLFVDPKAVPASFELSTEGRQRLEKIASEFAGAHVESLLIEGHTDANGPADANQIESYQRALTVKQHLSAHLGFESDRLIAIGHGENELLEDGFVPGHESRSRRIVFRVVQQP